MGEEGMFRIVLKCNANAKKTDFHPQELHQSSSQNKLQEEEVVTD
jgi:hypothetical protein